MQTSKFGPTELQPGVQVDSLGEVTWNPLPEALLEALPVPNLSHPTMGSFKALPRDAQAGRGGPPDDPRQGALLSASGKKTVM